jgi:hypothetical protein
VAAQFFASAPRKTFFRLYRYSEFIDPGQRIVDELSVSLVDQQTETILKGVTIWVDVHVVEMVMVMGMEAVALLPRVVSWWSL